MSVLSDCRYTTFNLRARSALVERHGAPAGICGITADVMLYTAFAAV